MLVNFWKLEPTIWQVVYLADVIYSRKPRLLIEFRVFHSGKLDFDLVLNHFFSLPWQLVFYHVVNKNPLFWVYRKDINCQYESTNKFFRNFWTKKFYEKFATGIMELICFSHKLSFFFGYCFPENIWRYSFLWHVCCFSCCEWLWSLRNALVCVGMGLCALCLVGNLAFDLWSGVGKGKQTPHTRHIASWLSGWVVGWLVGRLS